MLCPILQHDMSPWKTSINSVKPSGKPSALGSIGVDGGDDRVAVLAVGDPCLYIITKNGHLDDVRGDGRGRREGQEPAQRHERCRV